MDISIEAIEGLLAQAQANAGRPVATEALMRAQILATLYAARPLVIRKGDIVIEGFDPVEPDDLIAAMKSVSEIAEDVSFTGLIDAIEPDDDDDVEDLFGDAPKR